MLSFFRKYQKFFFLFVTVIIVMSFVFFGTFQAIAPMFDSKDTTLFKTQDGRAIKQSYLSDMTRFLALEPLSRRGFHNFLNDYIVSKEFLDSGIGYQLVSENTEKIQEEWNERCKKEKTFRLYRHPLSSELSTENIWLNFARPLHTAYYNHVHNSSFFGKDAYDSRVNLFLMERKFPSDALSYILRYHEKQSPELGQDPKLNSDSLALFGYHDLADWFGKTYVENAAKAIICGADFARAHGYKVSREEISAEVSLRANTAFQQIKEQTQQWPNSKALYYDCLKMLQLDETRFMAIMEDVLLFRRLFQDVSGLNMVDAFSMKKFYEKAHECAEVEIVTLPGEYAFKKSEDLKKFELYLEAVSSARADVLALPDSFNDVSEIEAKVPELVASAFRVEMAHISKRDCEAKVSLKETWKWQEQNLSTIQQKFPEVVSLDTLAKEKRAEVDTFSRQKIVEAHPEWIQESLSLKKVEEKRLVLPKTKLEGINNTLELATMLKDQDQLSLYTQDNEHYYKFIVKERLPKELLTFKEARDLGILDKMVKSKDEKHFDKVFDEIFAYAKSKNLMNKFSKDTVAQLRFAKYMNEVKANPECAKTLWPLPKKTEEVFRHSKGLVSFAEALQAEGKEVTLSDTYGPYFTRFVDRRVDNPLPLDKMLMEEKFLGDEIKGQLLTKILSFNG